MRIQLLAALLAAALAAPAPVRAMPVVVYPLDRTAGDDDAPVVQSLVEAAVYQAARRASVRPAEPLVARDRCGTAKAARRLCLAGLAGTGLTLRSEVRRAGGLIVVTLEAVDGQARIFGPVTLGMEIVVQNSEPLTRAILDLVARAESPPPALARAPRAAPPVTATAAAPAPTPVAAPAGLARMPLPPPPPPPAAAAAPVPGLDLARAAPTSGSWQAATAPWITACGLALAGVGGMYAASNQTLTQKLERKRAAGTLTEADQRWYRTSDQYSTISRSLLIAGGAVTASGLALWALAPSVEPVPGGVRVGVSGRF